MPFSTKQDQVADIIRERIIVGAYGRGMKLRQADLAEELGVSITPVREALLTLEAEGYVRGLPHKGLLVPELVPGQLREIYELRLMLERELTAIALTKITSRNVKELKELQRSLMRSIASGDLLAVRIANFHFHFSLYGIAERPQTLHFVRVLWAKYPFTSQDIKAGRPDRMRSEHELFLRRIEGNDHPGAVEAMAAHITSGWQEANSEICLSEHPKSRLRRSGRDAGDRITPSAGLRARRS